MGHRSNRRLSLLVGLFIALVLAGALPRGWQPALAAPGGSPIQLVPDQLALSGDVATRANTVGRCPEKWFAGTPAGTIMLGIDPTSCDPNDWNGGAAMIQLSLPKTDARTLLVLTLSWTNLAGKGLHSPDRDRTGTITLDNRLLWSKRTTQLGTYGDYYAAERGPIRLTMVLSKQSIHTLEFRVPARTAWDISQIEITEYPMPQIMHGVAYSPYRDCQAPDAELQPSEQDVADDLFQLAHNSNAIRTYAATGINGKVPGIANGLGLPVYAGAWIDGNPTNDEKEVQALIDLAHTTKLAGAIVGSEYYYRHQGHPDEALSDLEKHIVKVKQGLVGTGVPITTAEIDSYMFTWANDSTAYLKPEFRRIVQQLDFILIHIYPFWMQRSIAGAADVTIKHYRAMQVALAREHLNKRLVIGETGWPSRGNLRGAAVPSLENQRRYMIEFLRLAEEQKIDYMYFEAFDELWKASEGTIGQSWGYGYTDRTAKYDFFGVLLPSALLPSLQAEAEEGALQLPLHVPNDSSRFDMLRAVAQGTNTYYLPLILLHSVPFVVYEEWPAREGSFVPSGVMDDLSHVSVFECDRSNPHGGDMAIRATFTPTVTNGWAGVYWQYPENNWGDNSSGKTLTWANKLTFWAKGARGGEKVEFFVGGIGKKESQYPDSVRPSVSTGFIRLEDHWQQYTINLIGQDLSRINGGFGWSTNQCANPQGATFFLDDVAFEFDPQLPPPAPHGALFPVYTDAAAQDNHYVPSLRTGDGQDEDLLSFTECWTENPHSGQTSIKVAYNQMVPGWAGQYWVYPQENNGDIPGGIDLRGADRLTFWARSDTPNARVKFLLGGVGYPVDFLGNVDCTSQPATYADSVCPPIAQEETLSSSWQKYSIDLHQLPQPDLTKVVGGFGWVATESITFYLDDILYEFE